LPCAAGAISTASCSTTSSSRGYWTTSICRKTWPSNPQYKSLLHHGDVGCRESKDRAVAKEEAVVSLPENELGVRDQAGEEIYIDIPFSRKLYDALIASKVEESIQAARETLEKAGPEPHDVERVVFVGGPTHYKPLRDKVAFELGIAPSTDVNPMTAVAEGAAVFAESIDWASQSRGRKSARGALSAGGALDLSFNYIARTPEPRAKIVAKFGNARLRASSSRSTAWTPAGRPAASR
jgi:molecular chaperone DnaK